MAVAINREAICPNRSRSLPSLVSRNRSRLGFIYARIPLNSTYEPQFAAAS
jgi:hypothetical protein